MAVDPSRFLGVMRLALTWKYHCEAVTRVESFLVRCARGMKLVMMEKEELQSAGDGGQIECIVKGRNSAVISIVLCTVYSAIAYRGLFAYVPSRSIYPPSECCAPYSDGCGVAVQKADT